MSKIDCLPFENASQPVWDDIVFASKNGNFLHLRDYLGYHAHRFDEQSVIVRKAKNPIAVFPCNRDGDKIISHGGLTYAGLIYGKELHAVDVLAIFEELVGYFRELGCRRLIYKAIPHIFHRYPAEEDLYALYRMGARLVRRDLSSVVLLSNGIKLSDSRKSTIRKAERLGLEVQEGDFLDKFYYLLSDTLSLRDLKPTHSLEELRLLFKRFPGRMRLLGTFGVETGELLAGALVYDFGEVVHSQYLASSNSGKKTGALDLLLFYGIKKIFSNKQYFSFGISTENDGNFLNEGLIFQKEGFGGRALVHDFYEMEI